MKNSRFLSMLLVVVLLSAILAAAPLEPVSAHEIQSTNLTAPPITDAMVALDGVKDGYYTAYYGWYGGKWWVYSQGHGGFDDSVHGTIFMLIKGIPFTFILEPDIYDAYNDITWFSGVPSIHACGTVHVFAAYIGVIPLDLPTYDDTFSCIYLPVIKR